MASSCCGYSSPQNPCDLKHGCQPACRKGQWALGYLGCVDRQMSLVSAPRYCTVIPELRHQPVPGWPNLTCLPVCSKYCKIYGFSGNEPSTYVLNVCMPELCLFKEVMAYQILGPGSFGPPGCPCHSEGGRE